MSHAPTDASPNGSTSAASPPQTSRIFSSAKIIALCTVGSRITGLARDIVMNRVYGQGWVQDAFNYGFLIPNLFRRLFGEGALSAVFVPVFTEVLDQRGRPDAWRLLGRITGLMALFLTVLVLLLEGGVLAIYHVAPGDAMRRLQAGLTAVMLPFMIGVCLLALFSSILNCLHRFALPALMPIVLNLMNIAGAGWLGPRLYDDLPSQAYVVGWCVTAASVVQLALILPVLRAQGVRFKPAIDLHDPDVRRILKTFLPVMLGQGILLLNVYFDAQVCTFLTRGPGDGPERTVLGVTFEYPLSEGALSAVNNAQRLYQFPLGVLAISLATAALPMFSLYASRKDMAGLRASVAQSMRLAVFEGLPCGLILLVLAGPIVALLFEGGRFGPAETERAARVLQWYGLGMAAFCAQHIVLRAFYSLKDTLTPMWISCGLAGVNVLMNVTLIWLPALREQVFGISTSTTAVLHVAVSMWFLRGRMGGRMGARQIGRTFAQSLAATVLALAAAWLLLRWIDAWDLSDLPVRARYAIRALAPLLAAVAVYFGAALAMRMNEATWILRRRAERGSAPPVAPAGEP